MYLLDANQFKQLGDWNWDDFVSEVKTRIASPHRSVRIRNFNAGQSNELLIRLATSLGRPYRESGLPEHPPEDDLVSRVEPRGGGIRDSRNMILYSTTNLSFPSHTDGSGKPNPYDIVLLYSVRQDEAGGESILITLDRILKLLKPESVDSLRIGKVPVPFGMTTILSGNDSDMWIRYNAEELLYYSALRGVAFTTSQKNALADLAGVIASLEEKVARFRIAVGECLIIDNKRVLHGRSTLSPQSERLLKRVRLYWS